MAAESIGNILSRMNLPASLAPVEPRANPTPDCAPWCLGEGARRLPTPHRPLSDTPTSYVEKMRAIRYDYCPCPAGTAARERHHEALIALEADETQKVTDRLWTDSEIPTRLRRYSLESYLALPDSRPALVDLLRRWQLLARTRGRSLVFRGNPGTRKTGLGVSLLTEDLAAGRSGLYLQANDFFRRVRMANQPGASADDIKANEAQLIAAVAGIGTLLLDDVGVMSDWERKVMLQLVDYRVNWELPMILTTNLDLAELEVEMGKRSFDRLRESTQPTPADETFLIHLTGGSRRGLSVTPGADA